MPLIIMSYAFLSQINIYNFEQLFQKAQQGDYPSTKILQSSKNQNDDF